MDSTLFILGLQPANRNARMLQLRNHAQAQGVIAIWTDLPPEEVSYARSITGKHVNGSVITCQYGM
jgi:hypothetical protein